LVLSLVFLASRASFADTLTITGVGGQSTDGEYVYPYYFTVTGPDGTDTLVAMSCLNFNREVSIGQTWDVNVIGVSSITTSSTIDGESGLDILADAYLFNQYTAATGNAQQTSDIQFAIWSIMDPSDVAGKSGFDSNAQALAAEALSIAPTLPSSAFATDNLYVPSGSYPNGGEPQEFMVDPPDPPVVTATPEPDSLLLMATGLFGSAILVYRKRTKGPEETLVIDYIEQPSVN
jgi:hypothetical protein